MTDILQDDLLFYFLGLMLLVFGSIFVCICEWTMIELVTFV